MNSRCATPRNNPAPRKYFASLKSRAQTLPLHQNQLDFVPYFPKNPSKLGRFFTATLRQTTKTVPVWIIFDSHPASPGSVEQHQFLPDSMRLKFDIQKQHKLCILPKWRYWVLRLRKNSPFVIKGGLGSGEAQRFVSLGTLLGVWRLGLYQFFKLTKYIIHLLQMPGLTQEGLSLAGPGQSAGSARLTKNHSERRARLKSRLTALLFDLRNRK